MESEINNFFGRIESPKELLEKIFEFYKKLNISNLDECIVYYNTIKHYESILPIKELNPGSSTKRTIKTTLSAIENRMVQIYHDAKYDAKVLSKIALTTGKSEFSILVRR